MKLPKRDLPSYNVVLPVSGIECSYRPYTVKEQKILQMAKQSAASEDITNAVRQIIENCTNVNLDIIGDADFEYLIIKLMAVSVSPIAQTEITYDCKQKECPAIHPCAVNLETVSVIGIDYIKEKYTKRKNYWVVPFDEDSGVCMRHVTSSDDHEQTIYNSIVQVYDADGVYDEFTQDDLISYIDDLTNPEYEKIQEFINTQPFCSTSVTAKCKSCKKDFTVELKGVLDFLA
jgi:T4 bacteriophage base plate protein